MIQEEVERALYEIEKELLEKDSKIIEEIVKYSDKNRRLDNELKDWFNCNLYSAGDKDFETFEQVRSSLKSSDETVFKFILVYYFEKVGFIASLPCDKYGRKIEIKIMRLQC